MTTTLGSTVFERLPHHPVGYDPSMTTSMFAASPTASPKQENWGSCPLTAGAGIHAS